MTGRDRMVLIVIGVVVVLGAAWMLVVSPERQQANKLAGQVAAAQAQVTAAESTVSSARAAQSQYAAAYASLVSIGKAVPPSDEVPALIYQLAQASQREERAVLTRSARRQHRRECERDHDHDDNHVPARGLGPRRRASGTEAAGFTQLPFSFIFDGGFFDLEHLFRQLTEFATLNAAGKLEVNGRLLTIQSVSLSTAGGSDRRQVRQPADRHRSPPRHT